LQQRLEKLPHVQAAAPAIYEQVLISRGARAGGAVLKGIVPAQERRVTSLLDAVHEGSAQPLTDAQERAEKMAAQPASQPATQPANNPSADSDPSSLQGAADRIAAMPPIVLGKDLAQTLGAAVGSVVLVTSPQGELTPFGMVNLPVRLLRLRLNVGLVLAGRFAASVQPGRHRQRHRIQGG
jgi:lipoprotein-releasing system permease protein